MTKLDRLRTKMTMMIAIQFRTARFLPRLGSSLHSNYHEMLKCVPGASRERLEVSPARLESAQSDSKDTLGRQNERPGTPGSAPK